MKLKNNALQELYDTIVNCTITISPFAASPFDTAFRECDDKLSGSITFECIRNLQERNDTLERSNATFLEANLRLASEKSRLEKEIEGLDKENKLLTESRDEWSKRSVENRKQIIKLEKDLDDAKKQLNYFTNSRDDWRSRAKHAEKEVEDLKSRLNSIYGYEYIKKMQICLDPDIRQMECLYLLCV